MSQPFRAEEADHLFGWCYISIMNSTRRTIAKNVSSLMAAQIITWVLALALTVFQPRYLGAANVGKLQLASSIWGVMTLMIVFGTDILLTKEIARAPEKTGELVGTSNILRMILFGVSFIVVSIYVRMVGYPPETIRVIFLVGVSVLIVAVAGSYLAALQGLERMEYYSISDVLSKGVMTVVTIILLLMGYRVFMVATVMIFGSLIGLVVQFFAVRKYQSLKFQFDRSKAVWMLKTAFPYLLVSGFLTIYTQLDVIILSLLLNEESIGYYGVANRLFGTFLFVPTVFITALFPVLSRMYSTGSDNMGKLFQKSFEFLFLLSVPIGLGVFAVSKPVIDVLYGVQFVKSAPILAILGIVLIFTFQNTLLGRYFISIDQQNRWTVVMAVATVVTIPLDIMLIPICERVFGNGALGGGLSFLITEAGMMIAGLIMLPREMLKTQSVSFAFRTLLAGILMSLVAWQLRNTFLLFPIAAGGLVYVFMLLILRVIPKEDWELVRMLVQSVLLRFRKPKSELKA